MTIDCTLLVARQYPEKTISRKRLFPEKTIPRNNNSPKRQFWAESKPEVTENDRKSTKIDRKSIECNREFTGNQEALKTFNSEETFRHQPIFCPAIPLLPYTFPS